MQTNNAMILNFSAIQGLQMLSNENLKKYYWFSLNLVKSEFNIKIAHAVK